MSHKAKQEVKEVTEKRLTSNSNEVKGYGIMISSPKYYKMVQMSTLQS